MNSALETRYPSLRPGAEPQTFAREEDRARLGAVALKAYRSLAKKWGLTNAEAAKLIGISESSWDRVKSGKDLVLNQDQMTRVSVLVAILSAKSRFRPLKMPTRTETRVIWSWLSTK